VQDHVQYVHRNLRQPDHLVRIVRRRVGQLPLATGTRLGLDLDDFRRCQQRLAMPQMAGLGAKFTLYPRARGPFFIRRIRRRGRTIRVAGVLGHARVERGDPSGLLLDDGDQLDDQLAHEKQGLFPTDGIKAKPSGKWGRSRDCTPSCHASGGFVRCRDRLSRPSDRVAAAQWELIIHAQQSRRRHLLPEARVAELSRELRHADPLLGLVHGHDHREPRAQRLRGGSRMATYLGQQGKKLLPPFSIDDPEVMFFGGILPPVDVVDNLHLLHCVV
jgi:hypothetical protein